MTDRKQAMADLLEKVEAGMMTNWTDLASGLGLRPDDRHVHAMNAYHGSLNAAKALHEAVLPRHYAQVHMWPIPEMCRVDIGGGHTGRDGDPARAWLIAILKALIAKEDYT